MISEINTHNQWIPPTRDLLLPRLLSCTIELPNAAFSEMQEIV